MGILILYFSQYIVTGIDDEKKQEAIKTLKEFAENNEEKKKDSEEDAEDIKSQVEDRIEGVVNPEDLNE